MRKYTVLVAEDEELLLHSLVQKIHEANLNFQVVSMAQTGQKAWELINELSPQLLISDIKMPIMDGIDLIEKVNRHFPYIRTMIISGFSDFEYAQKAIHYQVTEYLLKPIDPEELHRALFRVRTQLELEDKSYGKIFDESMARNSPAEIALSLKAYIDKNYTLDINLNAIAQTMNYSPAYLTKVFCQQYKTTPGKYTIALKIAKAKSLCAFNLELSIREIGEILGYQDQGYFSRIFKKYVGVSPFEYRGKIGEIQ